ncbi:hypothetical protein [Pseudomonas syringae]|uniref:hypothetical protein n=1 Tax=Pseudomonas syringae TaxID=317 RepID=UPI0009B09C95|nr:hypothetical protein [Pseudomonas syringae]
MVNIPKPPSRVTGKGTPPRSDDLSTVVGNNTEKPEAKKDVPMNLRVPDEFKRRVDQFALITMQALEEFMNRAGAAQ